MQYNVQLVLVAFCTIRLGSVSSVESGWVLVGCVKRVLFGFVKSVWLRFVLLGSVRSGCVLSVGLYCVGLSCVRFITVMLR